MTEFGEGLNDFFEREMKVVRYGVLVAKRLDLSTYSITENVSRVFRSLWFKPSISAA